MICPRLLIAEVNYMSVQLLLWMYNTRGKLVNYKQLSEDTNLPRAKSRNYFQYKIMEMPHLAE